MIFNISYDLNDPGQDYDNLHDAIEDLGSCIHPMDSTWLVSTSLSVAEVREELTLVMDDSDVLLVNKASVPWASHKLSTEDNAWLKANL